VDVNSKKATFASSVKDTDWHTWTSTLGFPVIGIWPGPDFTDVNTTCRSVSREVLATGDDFGKVKIFKYPCVMEHASSKEYMGHSSHVTKVKFSANDQYVVSTGGNDKTVIIWETDIGMAGGQMEEAKNQPDPQYDDDDGFVESKVDFSKDAKAQQKEDIKKMNTMKQAPKA